MLLRKTGLRKAYLLLIGCVLPVTQFLWKLRAACGTGIFVPVYFVFIIFASLKKAASGSLMQIRTVSWLNRNYYMPEIK